MAISRPAKERMVESVRTNFDRAVAAVLVDFRGINVKMATDLRERFRKAGIEYRVVKNNLVRKALEGTELAENEDFREQLLGPTAIAWSFEDPSSAAKIIKTFRKEGPKQEALKIKGGLVDQRFYDGDRVEKEIATLPGKDEVRAQLLAQLGAPAQNLLRQLGAPGQNLAFALDARRRQQDEQG